VVLGLVILAAWVAPAAYLGGEAYRHKLLFTQTTARVLDQAQQTAALQSHARPWWWYLSRLPVILFPFFFWPRAWAALAALHRPLSVGIRFCLCWLLPMLVALSLISGKQAYYPLPELAGMMLLLAGAIAFMREHHPRLARNAWLGTWLLGLSGIALAILLLVLPWLIAGGYVQGTWTHAVGGKGRYVAVVFALLGVLLLWHGRGETRRLAIAGLIGALAFNTLFTLAWWPRYNLRPTALLLHQAQATDHAVAFVGAYAGQFDFQGRLTHPVHEIYSPTAIQKFASHHPDGLIVTHPDKLQADTRRYALLIQPFRSSWTVTWPARTLADIQAGRTPPEPTQPTRIIDPGHPGRYRGRP
jgi:hypothetical protein